MPHPGGLRSRAPDYWPRRVIAASPGAALNEANSTDIAQLAPRPVVSLMADQTPDQMRDVEVAAAPLLRLQDNWDGHGGRRISHDSLRFMYHLLEGAFIATPTLIVPALIPLSYGGVQAEWHTWRAELEIEVERVQRFRWYFKDRLTGDVSEGSGSVDFLELHELMGRL